MKTKKTYFRIESIAVGDLGGGHWEEDVIVSGSSPQEAYEKALDHLKKQGYCFENKIVACDREGDDLE